MKYFILRSLLAAALCSQIIFAGATPVLLPEDGMFHLYENNRRTKTPNFITTDFVLLAYSMILQQSLVRSEQEQAFPEFRDALHALVPVATAAKQSDPAMEAAAQTNRDFLDVVLSLIDGKEPASLDKQVSQELALIRAGSSIENSPLFGEQLDYTQLRPRGFYTRTPDLNRYFTALRYANSIGFYVQESAATSMTAAKADQLSRQAMLLAKWINDTPVVRGHFQHLLERQAWLFGPPDGLTLADLVAMRKQEGETIAQWRKKLLSEARSQGHQPAIFSGILDTAKLEPGLSAQDALTAWRFMPGSFTPDAAAQQQLIFSKVGKFLGNGTPSSLTVVNGVPVKGFPLALEIMGLLGSATAVSRLKASDETNYEGYDKAHESAAQQIAKAGGLPGENMALLRSIIVASSPATESDTEKLQTALGFWTLYRHAAVLYAKQSYTGVGKGIQVADDRKSAWLEPASQAYKALQRMSNELHTKLGSPAFDSLSQLLDKCTQISADEEAGHTLTTEQISFLNGLDKDLLQLAENPDPPVAVDVHTDPNSGQALTEATLFPAEVKHLEQRGARFRTTEFKVPIAERLTDEAWQQKLLKESTKK